MFRIAFALIAIFNLSQIAIACAAESDERTTLKHIQDLYEANVNTFPFGTFKFAYTVGDAVNDNAAMEGNYRSAAVGNGFYAFDGKNGRYEVTFMPDVFKKNLTKVSNLQYKFNLLSYRLLTDGSSTLLDMINYQPDSGALVHSAQIALKAQYDQLVRFPLNLGLKSQNKDLAFDVSRYLLGDPEYKLAGLSLDKAKSDLLVIKFKAKYGTRTYHVDMEKGCIPVVIHDEVDGSSSSVEITMSDIVPVAGAGWLPRTFTSSLQNGKDVTRIVLTSFELETPPSHKTFSLSYPDPVRLVDSGHKVIYNKNKVWSLLELPHVGLQQSSIGNVTDNHPDRIEKPPEMPTELQAGYLTWRLISSLTGVSLLLLSLYLFVLRRWRR